MKVDMGICRNFPEGGNVDICWSFWGCWCCNANERSQNNLAYCLYTTKKMPHESTRSIHIYFQIFKWSCTLVYHKCVLSVICYSFCWIVA